MYRIFVNFAKNIARIIGAVLVKQTSKKDVISLIEKIRPVSAGVDLIRIGTKGDGGYLVPDDLDGIEACFSPGVDKVSVFEADCAKRNMKVYMADKSVDAPNLDLKTGNYHFLKKFIGTTNDEDFITMDTWVNTSNISNNSDLLLQMDIEGSEYISFANISDELLKRFRIIVVEFHQLEKVWDPFFLNVAVATFDKILKNHTCVHLHPNNCCGLEKRMGLEVPRVAELTFLRNDRIINNNQKVSLPHPLDEDNTPNDTIYLQPIWFKG